jgi:DNA topoisomerase 2-associated protein PAT1
MSGFFGFDTSLPADRPGGTTHGFQARADQDSFLGAGGAADEDQAVYQWGDLDASLLEGGDDFNDETFGNVGDMGA